MKQIIACTCGFVILLFGAIEAGRADQDSPSGLADTTQTDAFPGGELRVVTDHEDVQPFPLKHTEVYAEISGNVAQVRVTQVFQNPYDRAIEAVYVFPLPDKSAVDDMVIRVGDRTIRGDIKKREEAREIYDQARRTGRTAALLDQERPNIFTQSVANILPGEEVIVSIRYFDLLPYDSGFYEFTFPMVVAPRFIPGESIRETERGGSPDTTDVPDASRITPPVLEPGERSGHDISLDVQLQAGAVLHELASLSHQVDLEDKGPSRARVRLKQEDSIPNKDFVLRYRLDGPAPEILIFPHRTEGPGYFLMLVQPEVQPTRARITPKEMIFVVDCSGSMSGFPIEKVKEAMRYALENLDPLDNFQIIRFSGRAESFAPGPVPATPSHIARALEYVDRLSGEGGTILLDGVKTALSYKEDPQRLRIISFMTDGQIGNEEQILAYLEKHLGAARLFSFGVGSSPNRYLLDKMAEFGRGAVQYLLPKCSADESIKDFYERVRSPYLTDLEVDWGDLRVSEIYPSPIPDLFLGQPVVLFGRYEQAGAGEVTLRGRLGGQLYERRLRIQLPDRSEEGEAISSLWARSKIEELSNDQIGNPQPEIIQEITDVALAHRLVSAYTSFVAVEEWPRTGPEEPTLVQVPVPMPEGASYEGVFGGTPQGLVLRERLQVAARASIVNTESTTTSTIISADMISELPTLGRDYQDVLT
ncbi:MAG TPA: marine proteobacterial sortase target protein, partial [Candidatus Polarisedimenticolia bacterium]|nr:marine proteobacterial sortase target protein [Candidatus Polarisedimenticolia bacterium]